MKKPLLFLSLSALSLASVAQTVIFEDNFDAYEADLGVSEQSLTWNTWDGTATPDALVSTAFAFSGTNSAKIEGTTTDLVLPIGPYSAGKYDLKFKMLVTDAGGYFNLLHQWSATSATYEWACDVFVGTLGGVSFATGGTPTSSTTTIEIGTWIDAQVTADLDNDMGYIYINGAMINSWQWSLNNADGTQGQNVLAAADFFGTNDAGGEGLYYIDDVQLIESTGVYTEEVNAANIGMWPNPANNQLTITLPSSTQTADVQIFDAQGRMVANTLVTTSVQNIDVTAFEAGLYTVRVVCGEKVYAQKLIIE
jgi:Secretion system C-terminal sorting domain